MEAQLDPWVKETQSTLKGVTTASLKGQHSRIRRAKARENWYNTGVSNEGQLIKPFKFVDEQELKCRRNSKLLSSIRSHVKQDSYRSRQTANAVLETKRRKPKPLHALSKMRSEKETRAKNQSTHTSGLCVDFTSEARHRHNLCCVRPYTSRVAFENARNSGLWFNATFSFSVSYGLVDRPQALFLLSHYRDQASKTWYPEAVEAVIQWTRSNIILLHATLYCAACHIRILTNSEDCSDIFYHRGEAMKIINQVLGDPVARVSNEVIGGLCHLVMTEEMYGSRRAASVHRKGLQRLFELRRALPGTSMNSIVRRLLPLTNLRLPSEGLFLQPNPTRPFGQAFDIEESTERKDPILEVFAWLKDTPLELPTNPSKTECRSAVVRVKLEYNLYSDNAHLSTNKPRRCWLLAALIYLHTIIATPDGWHLLSKMEAHLVEELRELLEEMVEEPWDMGFDLGVHLWILLFGGVHARDEDAAWYRRALVKVCEAEHLSEWDDIKLLMKSLPWVQEEVELVLKRHFSMSTTTR